MKLISFEGSRGYPLEVTIPLIDALIEPITLITVMLYFNDQNSTVYIFTHGNRSFVNRSDMGPGDHLGHVLPAAAKA